MIENSSKTFSSRSQIFAMIEIEKTGIFEHELIEIERTNVDVCQIAEA